MSKFTVALLLLAVTAAYAQNSNLTTTPTQLNNFMFTPETFEPALGEPQRRVASGYTGYLFSFNNASTGANQTDQTPNGMLQANQIGTNPFLSTLPGDGNGQTLVTLGPCSGNNPHTHPRGSEISFLLYGSITFGMVEENGAQNNLILRNMTANETIHVPQGILHFSHNNACTPAAFLANFATKDPGTQTIWTSMTRIPNAILHSATGIPEGNWSTIKSTYPTPTAPSSGSTECLQRCGLTFAAANKLTPVPTPTA